MVDEDQMKAKVILHSLFIDPSYKTGMLSKQIFKTKNTQWQAGLGFPSKGKSFQGFREKWLREDFHVVGSVSAWQGLVVRRHAGRLSSV